MPGPRKTGATSKPFAGVPTALESERAVIGAALRSQESAELVVNELSNQDFYSGSSQALFQAVHALLDGNLTVNPVSVSERSGVSRADIDQACEAAQGISDSSLRTLCAELRRISGLRQVYNACTNTISQLGQNSKLEDVTGLLEKGLYGVDREGADEAQDGANVFEKVLADFIQRQASGGGPEVSTGLRDLDRALIGLRPGKLGIIAARPSMGKTALADTIRRAVLAQGLGVIQFSLEMSAEELLGRELAYQGQLNLRKILSAKDVTPEELQRIRGLAGTQLPDRWHIDDRTYNIAGIRRRSKVLHSRMARKGIRTGLVVVDYLQLAGENGDGREQSIAAVSRGCKFLAKELGCTVLALSQLNRSCEYREDKRPMMSDIRESGSIEQDADWIGFVYREYMYDNAFPPEETEFIIRKHRDGPLGTVRLRYNPKLVAFGDVAQAVIPAVETANE